MEFQFLYRVKGYLFCSGFMIPSIFIDTRKYDHGFWVAIMLIARIRWNIGLRIYFNLRKASASL
jgi:hypothetical protein